MATIPQRMPRRAPSPSRPLLGLLAWLGACLAAGAVGAFASINAETFYGQLSRPGWAPPASVFGPVWTVLYLLMACAAWLVWRQRGFRGAQTALSLFIAQLVANALWTWLFFAWQLGGLGFAEIIVLWLLIAATAVQFWRERPMAAVLLLPYLGWVAFAAALNFRLWQLNPTLLG